MLYGMRVLVEIFSLLGFHPTWIHWIHQCITTTSFLVLLDGAPYGNFRPSRGLRQGDLLSPFHFILGYEILSRFFFFFFFLRKDEITCPIVIPA
jgi:hypothetical protein